MTYLTKQILTFDVEEWYDANYRALDSYKIDRSKSNIYAEITDILSLCDKFGAKATFFVLGEVAEKNPKLVRMIQEKNHEIASHGYSHRIIYNLSEEEFRKDVKKSLEVLESIIGKKIQGYRAPSASVKKETTWFYPVLAELGLKYSASVFPIKTFLYGIPDAPRFPHLIKTKNGDIIEIPFSTVRIMKKNFPFSGGFYFRILPVYFIKNAIMKINKEKEKSIIYIHPREIDPGAPRLKLPFKENFIHYWGVSNTKRKLENILNSFNLGSIESEILPNFTI